MPQTTTEILAINMADSDNKRMWDEDSGLFRKIWQEVKSNKEKFLAVGRWLDKSVSLTAYRKRQKAELKRLRIESRKPQNPCPIHIFRRIKWLEKEVRSKQEPLFIVRFQEAYLYWFEKYKNENLIPAAKARLVLLITWLLTDPDAGKANLNITKVEKWSWKPEDRLSSRHGAEFLFLKNYDQWRQLVHTACATLGIKASVLAEHEEMLTKVVLLTEENREHHKKAETAEEKRVIDNAALHNKLDTHDADNREQHVNSDKISKKGIRWTVFMGIIGIIVTIVLMYWDDILKLLKQIK